jgi:hypothetical protein
MSAKPLHHIPGLDSQRGGASPRLRANNRTVTERLEHRRRTSGSERSFPPAWATIRVTAIGRAWPNPRPSRLVSHAERLSHIPTPDEHLAAAAREVSRKTRPMKCPVRGRQTHTSRPRVPTRAGASAVKSGATALRDPGVCRHPLGARAAPAFVAEQVRCRRCRVTCNGSRRHQPRAARCFRLKEIAQRLSHL